MRVILVPVADRPECASALAAAFQVAKSLRANVMGCHLRPHRDSEIGVPDELENLIADVTAVWESSAESNGPEKDSEASRALLGKVAKRYGLRVVKRLNGSADSTVSWQERVAFARLPISKI